MTTEYSGAGDPARTLELLWGVRQAPSRGPKPGLDVPRIVRAAVELADAEGLPALSMRRLADRLGVSTMSLYTYVPGKAELIDLMMETVLDEQSRPERVEGGWRGRLEQIARENWALFLRHPWMLNVATSRPPLGPNVIAKYDYELRAVSELGLTDVEMDSVVSLLAGFVSSAARGAVEAAQATARTGISDEQWWAASAPLLEKLFDAERYPTAARVGAAAGAEYGAASDPEHGFEFGLQRMLDGIEVLVTQRHPE